MLNSVILMGRLVAEPELKQTTSQISFLNFTIAVDRDYTPKGEDKQTDFIDCTAWRQTAEFINRFFHKGSMIAIQGSLQTRNYEDKNGNKRKAVEIVVDKASFCGSKQDNAPNTEQAGNLNNIRSKAGLNVENDDAPITDDDLPF